MDITNIKAFDLPSVWYQCLKACMKQGLDRPVYRGARQEQRRKELGLVIIEITNPSNRPLVPIVKEGIPPPTSQAYVNKYVGMLLTPEKAKTEDYTYGERIMGNLMTLGVPEGYGNDLAELNPNLQRMAEIDKVEGTRVAGMGVNQLMMIEKYLSETPGTNRSIMEIGMPIDHMHRHPPCMRLVQFKAIGKTRSLDLFAYFRSWDCYAGLPSNLAALQMIKEHFAKAHKLKDGKMFAASMGLHVYSGQWEYANMLTGIKEV